MTQPPEPTPQPDTEEDRTTIYCHKGHECVWCEATEPGDCPSIPDGLPPMWLCEVCLWKSLEYPTYHDYKLCISGRNDD